MKKLLLISSFILALAACKKDEAVIPGPGITGNVKLVESITITTERTNTLSVTYDASNRVVKMQSSDFSKDYNEIQYSGNKIVITEHSNFDTQQLISDITIESGKRTTSNTLTEIYDGERNERATLYYEYNPDGTLKKLDARDAREDIGEYKKITTFSWTDGNLTTAKCDLTGNLAGTEITVMSVTAKITYLDTENNKTNLDFNWYTLNEIANENYDYTGILGYMGKSCDDYIAVMEITRTFQGETETETERTEIEYQFDGDGCPVQIKTYDVNSSRRHLYETYDITYKK